MAVPTIPSAIGASDIQTEFGGANPVGMDEYYSGGSYVGSGTANSTGTTIPTTGTISYANFSGAAAVSIKNWWYDRLYPDLNSLYYGIYGVATKLRNSTNAYAVLDVYSPSPSIRRDNGTYANSDWSYDILNGAGTHATGTCYSCTSANDDTIIIDIAPQSGCNHISKISSSGSKSWTVNTTNNIYDTISLNGGWFAVARGAAANSWIANVSQTNGTTINWYSGYRVSGYVWDYSKALATYPNEDVIILFGKTSSGPCCHAWYTANGTFKGGNHWTGHNAFGRMICDVKRTNSQSAHNIPVRFTTNRIDFGIMIMDGYTNPEISSLYKMPSGNVIQYVTHELDVAAANLYVFTIENDHDCIVAKTSISGSGLWTRKLASTRSGDHRIEITSAIATSTELVIYLRVASISFDTKYGTWSSTGYPESHVLRLPTDGTKTGTRANLAYTSISTTSLTSNGGMTSTANTPGNTAYTFSFVSNTRTLSSNTNYNINGTAI